MNIETKIAQLLRVAEYRLAYCEVIANYPASKGKKDFNVVGELDQFYKNVCVMSFSDVVLILGGLLKKDIKTINFWNWKDFVLKKKKELLVIEKRFKDEGLKTLRDEIIAHQNVNHPSNTFPDSRIKGYIHPVYIQRSQGILLDLIVLFFAYTKEAGTPYSPDYFNNRDARDQVRSVLDLAKPKLDN